MPSVPSTRRPLAASLLVAAFLVASWSGPARADDHKARAAEMFAEAQAAEARGQWRAAIDAYEAAYQLSPHPSVLYNIAIDHERLEEYRDAAIQFLRYLDLSPRADDRDRVLARVRALRLRPSRVSVASRPDNARILVDGVDRGQAPLILALAGGIAHQLVAETGGRRSRAHPVSPEYGEPVKLTIEITDERGLLTVETDVPGADVRIDGAPVGRTPLSAPVAAGPHRLTIELAGHRAVERRVEVPARGSEEVHATLTPLSGGAPLSVGASAPPVRPDPPGPARALLVGTSYGYDAGGDPGFSYALVLGARPASGVLDASALVGVFDGVGSVGGDLRVFLGRGALRPYLHGGGLYGFAGGEQEEAAVEGGAGFLWSASPAGPAGVLGFEYFLQISVQRRLTVGDDEPTGVPDPPADDDPATRYPLVLGIQLRFGG